MNAFIFFLLPLAFCSSSKKHQSCKENLNEEGKLLLENISPYKINCSSSETIFENDSMMKRNNFTNDDDDYLTNDTEFIVKTIKESHESLHSLVRKN